VIIVIALQDCVSLAAAVTLSLVWVAYFVGLIANDRSTSHHYRYHPALSQQRHLDAAAAAAAGRQPTPRDAVDSPAGGLSSTVIEPGEPCRPAETLRRRRSSADGRWFNYSKFPFVQFFVYSAFWDDRPSTEYGQPLVRVIAASTSSSAGVMTTVPVPLEYKVIIIIIIIIIMKSIYTWRLRAKSH